MEIELTTEKTNKPNVPVKTEKHRTLLIQAICSCHI